MGLFLCRTPIYFFRPPHNFLDWRERKRKDREAEEEPKEQKQKHVPPNSFLPPLSFSPSTHSHPPHSRPRSSQSSSDNSRRGLSGWCIPTTKSKGSGLRSDAYEEDVWWVKRAEMVVRVCRIWACLFSNECVSGNITGNCGGGRKERRGSNKEI